MEGLNKTTFLLVIIFLTLVLGFLPTLLFFCLKVNVPNLEILIFLSLFKFSIIKPVNELWDSKIRTMSLDNNNLLSLDTLFWGKAPISKILFLIIVEDMSFVYFGSINLPDHFFKVLITSLRVFFCTPIFQSSPWTTKFGFSKFKFGI